MRPFLGRFLEIVSALVVVGPAAGSGLQAQDPILPASFYGTASWDADSLGNHRVVLRVGAGNALVAARIPWRRRDRDPEQKGIWIIERSSGTRVRNAFWLTLTRESAEVIFEPSAAGGTYDVYYLLYRARGSRNYPRGSYLPPDTTADPSWLQAIGPPTQARRLFASLPRAELVRFESIDEFNSFSPMEVIAREDEVRRLLDEHPDKEFLVFPEDREHPVRMTRDLPARWIQAGPNRQLLLRAERGEYLTFQIGLYAARAGIRDVAVAMTDLRNSRGQIIFASSFTCFNTGGTDWTGTTITKTVAVKQGNVQALWMGILIPADAAPGEYLATLTTAPEDMEPVATSVSVRVADTLAHAAGDDEIGRLTRLRWLNSQLAADDDIVPPFIPLVVSEKTVSCLGRDVTLDESGMIAQIQSRFTSELTALQRAGRPMLAGPARLVVEDTDGSLEEWRTGGVTFTRQAAGAVQWASQARSGPFDARLAGRMEFDGWVDFRITLTARHDCSVNDIRLEVPMLDSVARYVMGMGLKGGLRPATFEWAWNERNNQDAIWLGDVNAGFQISFRDTNYERPLNTNFYLSKPLRMPPSWFNEGKGGFRFGPEAPGVLLLRAWSGPRELRSGQELNFCFAFLITPFKTVDTDAQWTTRYYHRYEPLEEIAKTGANTVNVHHATAINPYINYPFFRPDSMKAYVDSAHARGFKVKIYYTVRELANRAPELFMLRSLGDEILSPGPGGGFSWLQEHLDGDYIAAWFVPELKDAAVVTSGVSRWHNFYVEGLSWLVNNVGIDGLYIDDVAFDRTTMKRVRKVLDRGRPGALIDLHSANQFNVRDGFANSANLYLEHFPYVNRLWFGEYFDYSSSPDFWLIETSGLPFGLMGEMLEKGGNPWRGMIFGMTSRLPWAGDPRPVWKAWDEFGIAGSRMLPYFSPGCPVRTDHDSVLATVYLKDDGALVALASWSPTPAEVSLAIDWKALGIDPRRARIVAPAVKDFQEARSFAVGERIPVAPAKGWLLMVTEN